jgi:two-component system, LytTR family, response regulator
MRALIADDEALARNRLHRLLSAMPAIEIVGECQDGADVVRRVREGDVDVVLLDIDMPNLSGMDVLALFAETGPTVILCTAYAEHAVAAFDAGAVDYVLKPIDPARLHKALERARARTKHRTPPVARVAIPTRHGLVLVDPRTITHAVIDGELVTVYTATAEYLTDFTLQALEAKLPSLLRVHRRALLDLHHVVRLEPITSGGYAAHTSGGHVVEVSRQAARELRRRLRA